MPDDICVFVNKIFACRLNHHHPEFIFVELKTLFWIFTLDGLHIDEYIAEMQAVRKNIFFLELRITKDY